MKPGIRGAVIVAAAVLLASPAASIDINSSTALQYYGNGNALDLQTDTSGNTDIFGTLDMNNNNINSIGGLQSCGSNEFVNGNGNCATDTDTDNQNLNEVLTQGNGTGGVDIDLEGAELVDSTGTATIGGGKVEIPEGNLNMTGNNITMGSKGAINWDGDAGISTNSVGDRMKIQDLRTVETGGGFSQIDIQGSNGRLVIEDSSHGDNDFVQFNNGGPTQFRNPVTNDIMLSMNHSRGSEVEIPSGDLNVTGGNVTLRQSASGQPVMNYNFREGGNYGGGLEYDSAFGGDTGDNRVRLYTLQAGSEQEGITLDRSGNNVYIHRSLDMNNNNINDIGGLQSCGSNEFVNGNGNCATDTDTDTDNQNLAEVLDQGNSADDSNINMSDNNVTSVDVLSFRPVGGSKSNDNPLIKRANNGNRLEIWTSGGSANQQIRIVGRQDNQDIARFIEGSENVEIPNGNLDMSGNDIKNPGNTPVYLINEDFDDGSASGWTIDTADCGSSGITSNPSVSGDSPAIDPEPVNTNVLQATGDDVHLSPTIDATTYSSLTLKTYISSASMDDSTEDAQIQIYNGTSWVTVANSHNHPETGKYPKFFETDLSPYINSNFQLRFRLSGSNGCGDHGTIDEVRVIGSP